MLERAATAAFLESKAGDACITLSDPAFVQSDSIVIDVKTNRVFAVFHEAGYFLGSISRDMAETFASRDNVLLSALRGDGTTFELRAPLSISAWEGVSA